MATRLTDTKIKGLKAPASGQVEHSDSIVPGLRVRIGKSGVKTFILRKRVGGRVRNITVGRYGPRFGVADARRKARQLISDIEEGKGAPKPKAREAALGQTVGALVPKYLAQLAARTPPPRTLNEKERILERYVLPVLGDRMADAVTRKDVTNLIDELPETSPAMARAVHAQLSAFYSWALPDLDRLPANPCKGARRPAPAKPRDRVLSDVELAGLWRVADAEPSPWGPGLKLLILTGARRDEVFSACRAEFDLDVGEWMIPPERAKNGVAHIVPLTPTAIEVVQGVAEVEGSGKLFPTRTKSGQASRGPSGFSKAQARWRQDLDKALERADGPHWVTHDIRRTVATGLQRLGVRFEVTEAVLNHVSGSRSGVAGVYQRHDWKAEKRSALDAWERHIRAIVDVADRDNVIELGAA